MALKPSRDVKSDQKDYEKFLSYFFCKKKIPLSRRVAYVMHGSMGESVCQ